MPKKKKNIFDTVLNIIIILLAILVIYWFIELIFGGSPELSEFNFGLIVVIASVFIKIYREIGETKVEMKHLSGGVKESFNKIREDMGLIKRELKIK